MSKTRIRIMTATFLTVALLITIPGNATAAQQSPPTSSKLYKVNNVSMDSAYSLASSVCQAIWRERPSAGAAVCDVTTLERENMLAVTGDAEVQQRVGSLLTEFDRMPSTKTFQVIVLSATLTGTSPQLDIPEAARQALADFSALMPYKSFTIVGSGLLRTSQWAQTTLPGAEELEVSVHFRPVADAALPILVERFSISQDMGWVDAGADGPRRRSRDVLQTTFTINPGETAVVGTSTRAGEEGALVVLFTALQD